MTKKASFYLILFGGIIFLTGSISRFLGLLELSVILNILALPIFIIGIIGFIVSLIKLKV